MGPAPRLRFDDLLAQWNEPSPAVPRLVSLLDMARGRGSDALSRAASDVLQGLTLATVVGMARPASCGAPIAVMACFAAMLLLSAAQGDNIYVTTPPPEGDGFSVKLCGNPLA